MASRFQFVAGRWQGHERAISCDGLVPGAALDLSHWEGNRTPRDLAADTSTEIALRFVGSDRASTWQDAVVINNHFDTDGALSVWTLLAPAAARDGRGLLVAAAEAGDFDAWPGDRRGILVDAAVRALGDAAVSEAAAYDTVLAGLPELLDAIESREDLWGAEWERFVRAERDLESGRLAIDREGPLAIVRHALGVEEIPGPLLDRAIQSEPAVCLRTLLVFARDGGIDCRYERPRHAWADTVNRPSIASPEAAPLLAALGPEWTDDEPGGMTAIVHTRRPIRISIDAVLERLRAADVAIRSAASHAAADTSRRHE